MSRLPRHNFRVSHVIDSFLALFPRGVQISIGDADALVTAEVSCRRRAALLIVLDIGDEGVTEAVNARVLFDQPLFVRRRLPQRVSVHAVAFRKWKSGSCSS